MSLAHCGRCVACGYEDGALLLYSLRTGATLLKVQRAHSTAVWSVCCLPTEDLIASGGNDQCVRIWKIHGSRMQDPEPMHSLWTDKVAITSLAWHIDAARDVSTHVSEHDGDSSRQSAPSTITSEARRSVLAAASRAGTISLWEASAGFELLAVLEDDSKRAPIKSCVFSEKGWLDGDSLPSGLWLLTWGGSMGRWAAER